MTSRKAGPAKGKKSKKQEEAPIVYDHLTVRDCMTWRFQKGYQPPQEAGQDSAPREYHIPKKGEVGQAKSRGYDMPPSDGHYAVKNDEGTVIEAMRGWQRWRREQEEAQQNGDFYDLPPIDPKSKGQATDDKKDPWMGDLISHRFLMDSIRKRQEEEEEEARKAAKTKSGRNVNGKAADIKGNRTSQLRAIAMAGKVDVNPKDLWQISKFKNNARPHLTTVQKKEKAQKGSASGARKGSAGNKENAGGDPCTCDYDYQQYATDRPDSGYRGYGDTGDYGYGPAGGDVDYGYTENKDDHLFSV